MKAMKLPKSYNYCWRLLKPQNKRCSSLLEKAASRARPHLPRVIYLDTIFSSLAVDTPRCTLRLVSEDDVPFVWSVSRFPGFTAG